MTEALLRKNIPDNIKDELDFLLAKSFISGNIPDAFLENEWFKEFCRKLNFANHEYALPSRYAFTESIVGRLHRALMNERFAAIKNTDMLTVSLDGWTDSSGNSIYAVMLLKGDEFKCYIGNLDLYCQRHSANNIRTKLVDLLETYKIGMDRICAITTDSPKTMEKVFLPKRPIELGSQRHL